MTEGDSGWANLDFTLTRSGDLAPEIVLNYTTVDGTATAGTDYTAQTGTVTIPAHATTATISVPVSRDRLEVEDETFSVQLTGLVDAPGADFELQPAQGVTAQPFSIDSVQTSDLKNDKQPPPDLRTLSVAGDGQDNLELRYKITVSALDPFEIGFYRSADSTFDPADALLGSVLISDPADLTVGQHIETFSIGSGAGQVALPGAGTAETGGDYSILAVADHLDAVFELDADPFNEDNTAAFTGVYHLSGGDVFVHGTSGPDAVMVSPGSLRLEVNGTVIVYEGTDVARVRVRTHDGDDSLDFTYGAGFDTPGTFSLLFRSGAGANTAALHGSPGAETARINPTFATFDGTGFHVRVTDTSEVSAFGDGGNDVAKLYDSSGDDTFVATPRYGSLYSDGFYNRAVSFRDVHAFATGGGTDVAKLYDSAGDDHLEASGRSASLFTQGLSSWAHDFARVRAVASQHGSDTKHIASVDYLLETEGPWIDI
ncbi:MAG: Calx-beta domain-containing protein [Planctomycetota bacterium]